MGDFYFIVSFDVPAGKEKDFREELSVIAGRLRQSPGGSGGSGLLYEVDSAAEARLLQVPGISAALQNRPDGKADFRFVLIAHWESLSSYKSAILASAGGKPISFPSHPAYYRVAAEYTGVDKNEPQPAVGFTFINLFEIPEGKEGEFQRQWRATIERLNAAPGFLSARLYEVDPEIESALSQTPGISAALQSRPNGRARFPYVWISQWAELSQYEAAVRNFGRGNPLPYPSHPAFYQSA